MDPQLFTAIGMTPLQAAAYALLIEQGKVKPGKAAGKLKTTRTNAYKVFDKLVELQLATKQEHGKTFAYAPSNPLSLTNLTAQYRAEAVAREEAVSRLMQPLLEKYYAHSEKPTVEVFTGRQGVADAYRRQINLREDIHFIHTKADVPLMGYDTMHEIRTAPGRYGKQRQGIMAAPSKGPINHEPHKRSNLEVSWASKELYTAPVEWSVTESSLLIVLYADGPHAVLIADRVVASAFLQLWHIINTFVRQQPTHQKLSS